MALHIRFCHKDELWLSKFCQTKWNVAALSLVTKLSQQIQGVYDTIASTPQTMKITFAALRGIKEC